MAEGYAPATASAAFVAALYDAACNDDGYESFVTLLGNHFGVDASAIVMARDGLPFAAYNSPAVREFEAPYLAYYCRLDPWQQRLAKPAYDRATIGPELFSERELVRTEYWNDFGRHMGIFRPLGGHMWLSDDVCATLCLAQPFTDHLFRTEDKVRLEAILPYIKRALQLRLRLDGAKLQVDAGFAAFSALAFGVIVADAEGQMLFANAAAETMARTGVGLRFNKGRVEAVQPGEARLFAAELRRVAAGLVPEGGIRLADRTGMPAAIALVSPMPAPATKTKALDSDPAAQRRLLIMLRPLDEAYPPSPALLMRIFGLSPAQAAIALDVGAGLSVEEIAQLRQTKAATVRWHLKEIFRRCGVDGQRQLIRLLGLFSGLRRPG